MVRGWRDDGRELVFSGDNGEEAQSWTTVSLPDGVVTTHAVALADLSPNGRLLLDDDVNEVGCILADAPRVRLFDLGENREVAHLDVPSGDMSPTNGRRPGTPSP